jgi:hypothetical protein
MKKIRFKFITLDQLLKNFNYQISFTNEYFFDDEPIFNELEFIIGSR